MMITSATTRRLLVIGSLALTLASFNLAQAIPPLIGGPRENATVPAPAGSATLPSGSGIIRRPGTSVEKKASIKGTFRPPTVPSTTRPPVTPSTTQPLIPLPLFPRQPFYPPGSGSTVIPSTPPTYTPDTTQPAGPSTVVLRPNVVVKPPVLVPKQLSPLEGRVFELSTREAQCYGKELASLINTRFAAALDSLKQQGIDVTALQKQTDTIREKLSTRAPQREIEPLLKALLHGDSAAFPKRVLEDLQRIAQFIMVRDAFLVIAGAPPRTRGGPLAIAAIPVGMIWILLDPSLATGTALFVSDTVLVVGTGGQGELTIVQESAAAALGLPVGFGDPVPDINEAEAASQKDAIVIRHRPDAGSPVNYVLNGRYPYEMQPGHMHKLPPTQSWSIEFDRGNRQGTARYALTRGVYEFRVIEGRWDLIRLQFDVTIDNREGMQDFQYLAGDNVITVKAGETQKYSGTEPLLVKFDRGEGSDHAATKNLNKSGTYKVAVNTQNNLLDLFAMADSDKVGSAIP